MSVLIKGMKKPEHCGYCRFRYDGICHALQKTQYNMNECPLVVIDDAGLNDTISRQAAIEHLKKRLYETALNNVTEHPYYEDMADNRVSVWLEEVPSAQPERKTGRWIDITKCGGASFWKCSECGELFLEDFYYCPNCGAKMEVQDEG